MPPRAPLRFEQVPAEAVLGATGRTCASCCTASAGRRRGCRGRALVPSRPLERAQDGRRSTSSSVQTAGIASSSAVRTGACAASPAGRAASISRPVATMTARSTTCSSSRTLPGQACCIEHAAARVGDSRSTGRPYGVGVALAGTARPAAGCRSARSRSGGIVERDRVEPEEEILAQASVGDGLRRASTLVAQIRRKSASTGVVLPTGRDLALLQHAQQLGLQRQRHLADLVEQDRAAVGQLEEALAGRPARR